MSRAVFDDYGRPTQTFDALDRKTTTAYAPVWGYPNTVTVTNPAGHATTTTLHPERPGVPVAVVDPNGQVTSMGYDGFGRLHNVWLPTEQPTAAFAGGSVQFNYNLQPHVQGWGVQGPAWVRSSVLQSGTANFVHSYEVYDGFFRVRQTATPVRVRGRWPRRTPTTPGVCSSPRPWPKP